MRTGQQLTSACLATHKTVSSLGSQVHDASTARALIFLFVVEPALSWFTLHKNSITITV